MDRWDRQHRWRAYAAPARPVAGGVGVAKPGRVAGETARAIVDDVLDHCTRAIATRARNYARRGQVVGVEVGERSAVAQIQGSDHLPYDVSLAHRPGKGIVALCDCPYGCTPYGWCKHAGALAYVLADLVDRDPSARERWTGAAESGPQREPPGEPVAPELLDRLTAPIPAPDRVAVLARAAEVVPLPVVPD